MIRGVFGDDRADGSLYLFVSTRRDPMKALWLDSDGFVGGGRCRCEAGHITYGGSSRVYSAGR